MVLNLEHTIPVTEVRETNVTLAGQIDYTVVVAENTLASG
jgi:hypothetical protein